MLFSSYNLENPEKFYHHVKSSKDRRKNKAEAKNNEKEIEKQRKMDELKDRRLQKLASKDELKREYKKYSDKLDILYD